MRLIEPPIKGTVSLEDSMISSCTCPIWEPDDDVMSLTYYLLDLIDRLKVVHECFHVAVWYGEPRKLDVRVKVG